MAISAPRDDNRVPTLIGVSSVDGKTPVLPYVDPITHRLLVDTLGGGTFELTQVLPADGTWSGITEAGTAGATLVFGNICYLVTATSRWVLAKADVIATSGGVKLGMCVMAANNGQVTEMLLLGKIRADSLFPSLTVGAAVYISDTTAGAITNVQPSLSDHVIRVVGFGNSAVDLYFYPSPDYITHI